MAGEDVGAPGELGVRVVSYNVLAPEVARRMFDHYRRNLVQGRRRLPLLLKKLEPEVGRGAVICLQDVTIEWGGPLHQFFARHSYTVAAHFYGEPYFNHRGVMLAFPSETFSAEDIDISRLSDTIKWPAAEEAGSSLRAVTKWLATWLPRQGSSSQQEPQDPWHCARQPFNSMVFARLRHKGTGGVLCIATYAMPSSTSPQGTLVIHAALLAQRLTTLAGSDPYIVATEFNAAPTDPAYQLLLGRAADSPPLDYTARLAGGDTWRAEIPPGMNFRSAYSKAHGGEPEFTRLHQELEQPVHAATVDYVFVSPSWKVVGADRLPSQGEAKGPWPSTSEPSNHALLAVELRLVPVTPASGSTTKEQVA